MIFTGTGITAMGLLLVITTPNHPGAPADPALHPAVHWLLGGLGIIVGLAMVLTDVLFGHQPATPQPPRRRHGLPTDADDWVGCRKRRGESVWSSWCQCRECADTREASR